MQSNPSFAGGSTSDEDSLSSSMNLSFLKILPRANATRRSTFSVPKAPQRRMQVVLSAEEVRELKRTLSDPMISVDMVTAEDDELLSEWLAEGGGTTKSGAGTGKVARRRSVLAIPTPASVKTARSALRQLAAELDDRIPAPQKLSELFATREARVKMDFEAARMNPLHHLESVGPLRSRAKVEKKKQRKESLFQRYFHRRLGLRRSNC
jgi:hypothetical protein